MRKIPRIISWILTMALLCGQIPIQAFAKETTFAQTVSEGDAAVKSEGMDASSGGNEVQASIGTGMTVMGEDSFGTMLANELSEEVSEQTENNGYNVFSVEMQGDSAIVSFESVEDAVLVIGIYDETGTELLTTGSLEIYAGETTAVVDFESGSIPQYFYIRGYLIEPISLRPLCTVYESPMYTREMQEFLVKTTADFEEERVLNLDEDDTNNFAVYAEETILIGGDSGQNEVVMADESSNTYVIEDADSSITSLQPGDIFAYPYQDNDVLIVKVAGIEVDGTTVTITGADATMEEVFDYVKIEAEMGSGEATVDASSCGDGVTYEGLADYEDEGAAQTYGVGIEGSLEKAFKMKLDKKFSDDDLSAGISGGLDMKINVSAKVYLSFTVQYLEVKFDYSAKVSAAVTGEAKAEIPLVTLGYMFYGIIVELTPSVIVETEASISIEGTLSGTVGVRAQAGSGITNLTTYPQFKTALKMEGTFFVGLSLCPRVKVLSDSVASAGLDARVGAEVSASLKEPAKPENGNKLHTCEVCFEGEINGKLKVSANVKLINSIKFSLNAVDVKVKLFDFYYSADHDTFAWSTCPYYVYKSEIIVRESSGQPIQGAIIELEGEQYTTDKDGRAEIWLPTAKHIFTISKEGYQAVRRELQLEDGGLCLLVKLQKVASEGSGGGTGGGEGSGTGGSEGGTTSSETGIVKVSLGTWHSAAITENGDLYLWGQNLNGQLGDGTTVDSLVPKKIMSGVKEISLGYAYSAAVTESGDLYLWGSNGYGQLGDRTFEDSSVPEKIMSGVKAVSLGDDHSAAITENGDLYLWGNNDWGQLGDGTDVNSPVPKKIMSGVKAVSLDTCYSAAITENGDLYLWGLNGVYGQFGDGTTVNSSVPKKIMSGVKEVSLDLFNSAAITENGDLYLWGCNDHGQLGDGTTVNSSVPKKIMSGVKEVSLAGCSAAITESGDLYLWGINARGQLGDGTTVDSSVPKKIMSGVKAVSLGAGYSAAITESGDLYLWGYNVDGRFGDGTTVDSSVPVKITIPPAESTVSELALFSACAFSEETDSTGQPSGWDGTKFTGLIPNETYNYYVMKDGDAEQPFATDNLLYINQAVADESGSMDVTFSSEVAAAREDIFAVQMHPIDLSDAVLTVEDVAYNGTKQYAEVKVTYGDVALVEGKDYNVREDYGVTEIGTYHLTVEGIGLYTGTLSAGYKVVEVHGGIEGTLTCYGDAALATTLQLLDSSGKVVAAASVNGNSAEYTLENIFAGTYTLKVSKEGHVTREYSVTVEEDTVTQDVQICQSGDMNGDGSVNARDKKMLYNYIASPTTVILEDYFLSVADVTGDGSINARDKKVLYNHIAGVSLMW